MNDDELIARLRRSLRQQAEDLQPTPHYLAPSGTAGPPPPIGPDPAGAPPIGPDPARPPYAGVADPTGPPYAGVAGLAGPPTSEYQLLAPTGEVPVIGRRRWLAGAAAVAVAAAAIAVAVIVPGSGHPLSVRPARGLAPGRPTSTVAVPAPATTLPTSPTGTAGPPADLAPVPVGFEPASATFVSAADGWAIGSFPCSDRLCPAVARSTDGGASWSLAGTPDLTGTTPPEPAGSAGSLGQLNVRFANTNVGWVWTDRPGADPPSQLFRTTDGGQTWQAQTWGFPGSTIADLEISGGWARLVAYGPCADATTSLCQGQTVEEIFGAPIGADKWAVQFVEPDIGAGPVLAPALTLSGSAGWLVNDNRSTVSAARLVGGNWQSWTPPCADANGPAYLGAASADQLVALCAEGLWGPPAPGTTADSDWLWVSTDGGTSFGAVAALPGTAGQAASVSAAPGDPATIAVADTSGGLLMTFDGGRTWQTAVAPAPGSGVGIDYVGFTTATQAFALGGPGTPAMYMTYDGGHHWQPIAFGS